MRITRKTARWVALSLVLDVLGIVTTVRDYMALHRVGDAVFLGVLVLGVALCVALLAAPRAAS